MMEENGVEGLRVREMVDAGMMQPGAVTSSVPRGWLAGVRGALRN
jgi:type IV pilus assembly protein PilM